MDKETWWWNEEVQKGKERRVTDIAHVKCIKDDFGRVLTNDDEIKETWKAYFETLMHEENQWDGVLENPPQNIGIVREISEEEVKQAIKSMKNGKAVGPEVIPVEV